MPRLLAFWLRVLAWYGLAMMLMIACWTFILYFNQEYRSPSYQTSFATCLRSAAWMAPTHGTGPFAPFIFQHISRDEPIFWIPPVIGLVVYTFFASVVSRVGRKWPSGRHVFIGIIWILAGAIISMMLVHK